MSIKYMSSVWDHAKLNGNELLLLLALADYADGEGRCWPKVATLAKRIRVSKRQTQRYLANLAANGYITRVVNPPGVSGKPTIYTIHPSGGRGDMTVARPGVEHDTDDTGDDTSDMENSESDGLDKRGGDSKLSPGGSDVQLSPPSEPSTKNHHPNTGGGGEIAMRITPASVAVQMYENEIGLLTPTVGEMLYEAIDEYGADWVVDAIRLAAQYNKRSWAYCNGILKRWGKEGRGEAKRVGSEPSGTLVLIEGDAE